ncbi:MAG: hypothetical protein R6V16_10800, partial [Bacteroidales bacterium]
SFTSCLPAGTAFGMTFSNLFGQPPNLIIFCFDDSFSDWHGPASRKTSTVSVKKNLLFEPSILCELAEGNH